MPSNGTSALMLAAGVPENQLLSDDSDYQASISEVKAAQKKLTDLLTQRESGGVSVPWLMAAGALLDPGRTGSFGEAVGRAATAFGAAKQVDDKENISNAAMRMQLANAGLDSIRKTRAGQMLGATGRQAGMLPTDAGPIDTTNPNGLPGDWGPVPEWMGKTGSPGAPGGAGPYPDLSPPITLAQIRDIGRLDPEQGKIAQAMYDNWEKAIKVHQWGLVNPNAPPGQQVTPVIPPGSPDVEIRFPEFGGDTFLGSPDTLVKLRNARSSGDVGTIDSIYKFLKYGNSTGPSTSSQATEQPGAGPNPTVNEGKATLIKQEENAREIAKQTNTERQILRNKSETANDSKIMSDRIASTVKAYPKLFDMFRNPGVGNAIVSMVQEGMKTPDGSFQISGLENALKQAWPDVTPEEFQAAKGVAQDFANLQLKFQRSVFQGQGQVSNYERQQANIALGADGLDAKNLQKRMQLFSQRAQLDQDTATMANNFFKKNPLASIDDFYQSKEYKDIWKRHESFVNKMFGVKPQSGNGSYLTPQAGQLNADIIESLMRARGLK